MQVPLALNIKINKSMQKITFLFTLLFLTGVVLAANDVKNDEGSVKTVSVKGKVIDKITGEALTGVKVNIEGTEKSVYTDFDGNFVIDVIQQGTVELKATYISYKDKVKTVKLGNDTGNSIELEIESFN